MDIQKIQSHIYQQLENSDIFYLIRTDLEGRYTYVNPLFQKRFSFLTDDFVGKLVINTIHQEDIEVCNRAAYRCMTQRDSLVKVSMRKPNKQGGYYWTNWEFSALSNQEGDITEIVCIGYDVTNQELSKQSFELNSQKTRDILESIRDGFFAINKDWFFTYINNSFEKLVEVNRNELLGRSFQEVFPEVLDSKFYRACERAMSKKESAYVEELYAPLNKWFSFAIYPTQEGVTIYFQDISDRKHNEQKIRKQEVAIQKFSQRFKIVTETARIGIWEWDVRAQKLTWNEQLLAIYGIHRENIESDPYYWKKLIHPEDRRLIDSQLENLMVKGQEIHNIEFRIIRQDGVIRYNQASASPILDEEGNMIYFIGANVDITNLIEVQENLKSSNIEIRRFNAELENRVNERTSALIASNQDLEAFAYSISHDLRAPLRRISGFANLLEKHMKEASPQAIRYLAAITKSSEQMYQMISELLEFSRIGRQEVHKKWLQTDKIIKEIVEAYKIELANRELTWLIHPLPDIWGDLNMIKSVFENLIANAVKFTTKQAKAIIEIGVKSNNDQFIEFYIKDNGVGFDMNYAHKLFGVFQRLHSEEEFSGTGIGLANVKRIIQKHKGDIYGQSVLGEGATFFILLPINSVKNV